MALVYNVGAEQILNGGVDLLTDTLDVVLVKSSYTPNRDDTNAVLASAEISGVSGYVGGHAGAGRRTLASKTVTRDNGTDRVTFDAADPSAWTLGAGDTIGGAIIIRRGTSSDATAVPLFHVAISPAVPTNGSSFTLQFDAAGIAYIQQ